MHPFCSSSGTVPALQNIGLTAEDRATIRQLYDTAYRTGMYDKGAYIMENEDEYWAEGTQVCIVVAVLRSGPWRTSPCAIVQATVCHDSGPPLSHLTICLRYSWRSGAYTPQKRPAIQYALTHSEAKSFCPSPNLANLFPHCPGYPGGQGLLWAPRSLFHAPL